MTTPDDPHPRQAARGDGQTIRAGRVLTSEGVLQDAWIQVQAGSIIGTGVGTPPRPGDVLDLGDLSLAPGLVDLHVHGGLGHDFLTAGREALAEVSEFFARHGVTGFLATTYSAPIATIVEGVQRLTAAATDGLPGARLLGVNLEGPFVNPCRRGAHAETALRVPDLDELVQLVDSGQVRVVTLAPELTGADLLIKALVERGIVAAVGHTDATAAQVSAAARQGARLVTHTFNGMSGIHHRDMGAAGGALLDDQLICELIADGVHVGPEALELAWRTAGPHRIALVTDGGPAMGASDGAEFWLGDQRMRVSNGVGVLDDGTICSSTYALDHGIRTMAEVLGRDVLDIWPSASTVPAAIAGAPGTGSIHPGARADLVALDRHGHVQLTMVGGRVVWDGR